MAKARRIQGLAAEDPYAGAAAQILSVRVMELFEQAGGVLDTDDIERVHDMRVATRRLRAALEVFAPCFPRAELKAALGQVKSLADALGERRDRDVAIATLQGVAASLATPDRPGIETLIGRLRKEQAEANEALAPFVTESHLTELREQLTELVASAEVASDRDPVGSLSTAKAPTRREPADNGARPQVEA